MLFLEAAGLGDEGSCAQPCKQQEKVSVLGMDSIPVVNHLRGIKERKLKGAKVDICEQAPEQTSANR